MANDEQRLRHGAGAKSYCCKSIPKAFTNCAWYTKETHQIKLDDWCEASCPPNSIKLGRQRGDCSYGQGAYCCKGHDEPDLETPEPGFGGKGAEEFKTLIKK